MTTTNHALTGAAIALAVKQPELAILLALASHFAVDAVPHYGYDGGGFGDAFKHKMTFVSEAINIIGIPLLVYLLWRQSIWAWLAAFAAVSPDLMWVYRYFWFERKGLTPPTGPITKFHIKIQWAERPWGVAVEYAYFALIATLV
ncbi:MAG TPA: hypothetical protein VGG13_04080 [Candidatus Saccharimonadales bacterium]|jgi:hypothetical protein